MIKRLIKIFIYLSLGVAVFLAGFKFLRVQTVKCVQGDGPCSADVMAELYRWHRQNIFLIRPDKIEEKILKANISLKEVKVKLIFPLTLSAKLTLRKAVANFVSTRTSAIGLQADQDGVVISDSQNKEGLPEIIWAQISDFRVGDVLPEEFKNTILLVSNLSSAFSAANFEFDGKTTLRMISSEGIKVSFSTSKDFVSQAAALQELTKKARIDGEMPKEIDLRFQNPIIK